MTNPDAPSADSKLPADRRYLRATLAGAGGLLALLWFLVEQRPELAQLLLERIVIAWGPQFVILLLLFGFLYLLADRYAPRLIAAQRETAVALQSLARAVEQLVARDNSFQREQDVLLNHVARRVEAIHKLLESQGRALNGHLARLSRPPRRSGAETLSLSKGAESRGVPHRGTKDLSRSRTAPAPKPRTRPSAAMPAQKGTRHQAPGTGHESSST